MQVALNVSCNTLSNTNTMVGTPDRDGDVMDFERFMDFIDFIDFIDLETVDLDIADLAVDIGTGDGDREVEDKGTAEGEDGEANHDWRCSGRDSSFSQRLECELGLAEGPSPDGDAIHDFRSGSFRNDRYLVLSREVRDPCPARCSSCPAPLRTCLLSYGKKGTRAGNKKLKVRKMSTYSRKGCLDRNRVIQSICGRISSRKNSLWRSYRQEGAHARRSVFEKESRRS